MSANATATPATAGFATGRTNPAALRVTSTAATLALLLAVVAGAGCESGPQPAASGNTTGAAGRSASPLRATVAMVNGQPVAPEELWPAMAEAVGGEALQDLVLDRQVRAELVRRGVVVDDGAIRRERELLMAALADDREEAGRLLERLRTTQRLGPTRFDESLRRSAALRALVAIDVQITESAVRLAHQLATAPRRQVRIAVLPSLSTVDDAMSRLRRGEPFAEVATELSGDASAARGGLLEPISAVDSSWPDSLRSAIFALAPGEVSSPVLLDQGYAIATLVRELPATDRPLESMRDELERTVRLAQERVLMDQLARRLLREAQVTVFDDPLEQGWRRVRSSAP